MNTILCADPVNSPVFSLNTDTRCKGRPILVLWESGNSSEDEFGTQIMSQGMTPNAYRYTGQQSDADSGLLYLRARYYEPSTGRFITQDKKSGDPKIPSTLNLYVYCRNNPLKYTDPSGYSETAVGQYWDVHWKQNCGKIPVVWPEEGSARRTVAEKAKAYLDKINDEKQQDYKKTHAKGGHYQCNSWSDFINTYDFLTKMRDQVSKDSNQDLAVISPFFGRTSGGHVYVYLEIVFKDSNIESVWLLTETNAPRLYDLNPLNNDTETGYATVPVITPKMITEPNLKQKLLLLRG